MNTVLKKIGYSCLHLLTLGKGINKKINGVAVKFPTWYFRYFPEDYEQDNFLLIKETVKQDDVVIDIGAHIGLMAVVFGKLVGKNGKVYSFEPTPHSYGVLKQTIHLNKLENIVEPVNKAVSSASGSISFNVNREDVSNSIVSYEHNSGHKPITVQTVSIDDFVKEKDLSRLDFIKIDAEGVELDVLKGATKTLADFDCKMILALHPLAIETKGDSLSAIYDTVANAGFSVYWKNAVITKTVFCEQQHLFDVFLEKALHNPLSQHP